MDADAAHSADRLPPGVPAAVVPVAMKLRARAMHALGERRGTSGETDDPVETAALLDELLLPLRLEPDWPGPMAPQRVLGGWVQADVTDDDLDTLDRLRAVFPDADPETFAAAAQQWRLPVLPYRRLEAVVPVHRTPTQPALPSHPLDADGLRVLDLTSLWAGPFATALLADHGAEVVKIDPDCRPDGFGERPNLYTALNRNKEIVSLDLRYGPDRSQFDDLVRWADVLISSFSRRVLPNLGLSDDELRRRNPQLRTVAIVGFAAGSVESDWLAYGSGIHAVSGLGLTGGVAQATPLAYPDPLTGYLAVSAVLSGVSSEVPLALAGQLVAAEAARRTMTGVGR